MNNLDHLPAPSAKRIAVHVTPVAVRALRQGHPWLFEQAIVRQSHAGRAGDLAVVFDQKGRFLAVGLYDPHSPIRVRVLIHGEPAAIDEAWFLAALQAAAGLRGDLPAGGTTGYRLVHGENDGLPGLVVDRYADTCVMKLYSAAWIPHLPALLRGLQTVLAPACVVLRLSRGVQKQTDDLYGLADGSVLAGPRPQGSVLFLENGLSFEADVLAGQKTGFFLDQRENRARVEPLAQGKAVLNVFAYSGAFAVYAARGGARLVVNVESSGSALEAARRNIDYNRGLASVAAAQQEMIVGDAFSTLGRLRDAARRFDMVILDPPAFARSQAEITPALASYAVLVRLGLGVLRPGGTFVMSSCSSRVSANQFFETVYETAARHNWTFSELARTVHPLDHPIGFDEGAYLKCLFAIAQPV